MPYGVDPYGHGALYTPVSSRQGTPVIDPRKQAMLLNQLRQLQDNQQHLDQMMSKAGAMSSNDVPGGIPPLNPPKTPAQATV